MSFILNAIRKSEQQRQEHQSETLENRVLENQLPVQKKKSAWLIVLVIVNIIVLCYFIWLFTKEDDIESKNSSVPTRIEGTVEDTVIPIHPPAIEPAVVQLGDPEIKQEQASISEQLKRKHSARQKQLESVLPPKTVQSSVQKRPISPKKESMDPPEDDMIEPSEDDIMVPPELEEMPVKKAMEVKKPKTQAEYDVVDPSEKDRVNPPEDDLMVPQELEELPIKKAVEVKKPKAQELPFLSELEAGFRRKVPEININVFVYSENKDSRFIMIDMKKYVVGEDIGSGVILKDIHMNGIVVDYRNKKFKIKRK